MAGQNLIDPSPWTRLNEFRLRLLQFEDTLNNVSDDNIEANDDIRANMITLYTNLDQQYQDLINQTADAEGENLDAMRSQVREVLRRCRQALNVRYNVPFPAHELEAENGLPPNVNDETNTNQEGGKRKKRSKSRRSNKRNSRKTTRKTTRKARRN